MLTMDNAVAAAEDVLRASPPAPRWRNCQGIVICAGGVGYNTCAWVLIRMLRHLGCDLPLEVWYAGEEEHDTSWERLVRPLGVATVDADVVAKRLGQQPRRGWAIKSLALLHSSFCQVLLLDADNVPVVDPTYLFDCKPFGDTGAVFWPDGLRTSPKSRAWEVFGVPYRDEWEQESGQILIDKQRCWRPLRLCDWYNEHSGFFYRFIYGDKDTYRFAWRKVRVSFVMAPGFVRIPHTLVHRDLEGRRVFQHRCMDKWSWSGNRSAKGFWYEQECLAFLEELRSRWNPVNYLIHRSTQEDQSVAERLVGRRYQYVRVGHQRRSLRLGPAGRVKEGWSRRTFFWWVERGRLQIAGSDGRLSCSLRADSKGMWAGPCVHEPSVAVELRPFAP